MKASSCGIACDFGLARQDQPGAGAQPLATNKEPQMRKPSQSTLRARSWWCCVAWTERGSSPRCTGRLGPDRGDCPNPRPGGSWSVSRTGSTSSKASSSYI